MLYPGERRVEARGLTALVRSRAGRPDLPLVVVFPGGGHLARIAYGHPGAAPADFLLPQLEARGFGTLALSYPTTHPAVDCARPDLGVRAWAEAAAEIVAATLAASPADGVIGLGWSLGGRVARRLAGAAEREGFDLKGFIGLSAVPPLPGFGSLTPSQFALAPSGLWDASGPQSHVAAARGAHLDVVDALNGRVVIPRDIYARDYLCDTPLGMRGEPERVRDGRLEHDLGEALADQGGHDFAAYPLLAAIAASGQADARHDLGVTSAWTWLNAQALHLRHVAPRLAKGPIADDRWAALQALFDGLGPRLGRRVPGSHMFFVGEAGAAATADHIRDLIAGMAEVRSQIATLTA